MAPSIFGRFFGGAISNAAGFAIGVAVAPTLNPLTQALANEAWTLYPDVPPDAVLLAQGVAQGQIDASTARAWASSTGFGDTQFDAMVAVFDGGPGLALAFELWRRGLIAEPGFRRAARREGLEQEWIDALVGLRRRLLSPSALANAVVQGFRSQAEAAADAELQGVDAGDFTTMVDVTGLPPGPETLQEWTRRGIITQAELGQGIREGHMKTKYIDEYVASLERVLSAPEYAGLWLRGWITEAEAKAGGAQTGYSSDEMDLLYKNRGRPATVRQIHIGYARGASLPGAANEEEALETAVKQSNIRTEYVGLLKAQRYTYPSPFVIRALAQAGTFDTATTRQILIESGWRPDYAELTADAWTGADEAAPSAKWADRARSSLFSALRADYMDGGADEPLTRDGLARVGATGGEQDAIITMWEWERDNVRRDLTQAQILKLYKKTVWQREQALARLEDLGMESGDASDLLDSV